MSSERRVGGSPVQSEFDMDKAIDVVEQLEVRETPQKSSRGFRFWIIFLAVCVCLFLSALEYVRFAPTEIYT